MDEDKTWGMGLIYTLNNLKNKYKYVLLTLEDLFIIKRADNDFVKQSINKFINLGENHLKLYTKTRLNKQMNEYFREISYKVYSKLIKLKK
jgi:hypothetical protein